MSAVELLALTQPPYDGLDLLSTAVLLVDGDTQRTRDSDRRRILEDELRGEEERLAKLKSEFNNGEPERRGDERNFALYKERVQRLQEDIARTENNVRALAREMSLLKIQ